MRFGLALPHYDTSLAGGALSWDGVRRTAQAAEGSGYDSVWVSDHLFLDWSKYGGSDARRGGLECWTALSALAAATERVRLGSLTLCNDLRNPALVAKMATSLDLLSGGRLDIGLGAGWYEPEYAAAGIEFAGAGTRIARLGEAAEIITRLLSGEELTYRGRFYDTTAAVCRPEPVQDPRPPLWIGGKGDRLLETVAHVADGWNFSWIGSIDAYRDRVEMAERICDKAGRDGSTLRRSAGVYLVAGRDDADVKRRFERLVECSPRGVLPLDKVSGAVSWEQFRQDHIAGTTGEVIEKLGRLADLGVEEVILSIGGLPFQVADEEDVEFVGAEIAPALR